MSNHKMIAIVGETASGKSGLGQEIAERFNGEIINADSWAIYKDMNIGTAKPTTAERQRVRHHLIDIVSPDGDFTAAEYKDLALKAIDDIVKRSKLPILVGGTGLYVDSVLFDYSFAPAGDVKKRQSLNQKTIAELLDLIKARHLDLIGIDTRNKRRLIRLLETGGKRPTKSALRSNSLLLGVRTSSRAELRSNIEKRVEVMFRRGLKHEVRELQERYGWEAEAMKGIGYREFRAYFDGDQSLAETKRKIVKNTLELAKRQRTWFKRNSDIVWIDSRQSAIETTIRFLEA